LTACLAWRCVTRSGLRGGLKPYAQARYRKLWGFGTADRLDCRQTLFRTLDDRIGSTAALSYEHAVSPTRAAGWLDAATITQVSKNFEWSSGLGPYKSVGDQRPISLEALAGGHG